MLEQNTVQITVSSNNAHSLNPGIEHEVALRDKFDRVVDGAFAIIATDVGLETYSGEIASARLVEYEKCGSLGQADPNYAFTRTEESPEGLPIQVHYCTKTPVTTTTQPATTSKPPETTQPVVTVPQPTSPQTTKPAPATTRPAPAPATTQQAPAPTQPPQEVTTATTVGVENSTDSSAAVVESSSSSTSSSTSIAPEKEPEEVPVSGSDGSVQVVFTDATTGEDTTEAVIGVISDPSDTDWTPPIVAGGVLLALTALATRIIVGKRRNKEESPSGIPAAGAI
jgi:hypothetical protein